MGVLQCHISLKLVQRLQCVRDVRLRLALEESLVALLAEAGGRVHNELGERAVRDAGIGSEIIGVRRFPTERCVVGSDLEQDQIVLPVEMVGHLREGFPINTFVINAESAPAWVVLEHLVQERCDPGPRFSGAGVAGNQPATTEIFPRPRQPLQSHDRTMARAKRRGRRVGGKNTEGGGESPRERWGLAHEKVRSGYKGQAGGCESKISRVAHCVSLPIRMPASSASAAVNTNANIGKRFRSLLIFGTARNSSMISAARPVKSPHSRSNCSIVLRKSSNEGGCSFGPLS